MSGNWRRWSWSAKAPSSEPAGSEEAEIHQCQQNRHHPSREPFANRFYSHFLSLLSLNVHFFTFAVNALLVITILTFKIKIRPIYSPSQVHITKELHNSQYLWVDNGTDCNHRKTIPSNAKCIEWIRCILHSMHFAFDEFSIRWLFLIFSAKSFSH